MISVDTLLDQAGQHLDVRLTAEDGYTAERSYSIASAPGEPLAITVERLPGGEVSPYRCRSCASVLMVFVTKRGVTCVHLAGLA